MSQSRILKFLIVIVLVALFAGLAVYIFANSDKNTSEDNKELQEIVFNELNHGVYVATDAEITAIVDPLERFEKYITTAGDANFEGDRKRVIELYRGAAVVEGIDPEYRTQVMVQAFAYAVEAGDKDAEEFFRNEAGNEAIDEYTRVFQENQKRIDGQ